MTVYNTTHYCSRCNIKLLCHAWKFIPKQTRCMCGCFTKKLEITKYDI